MVKMMELKDVEEIRPNLFVKKTKNGYRQVYPIHKDISKPLSWSNIHWKRALIGNPDNFIAVIFLIAIIVFLSFGYSHDLTECKKIIERGDICSLYGNTDGLGEIGEINFSNITWNIR